MRYCVRVCVCVLQCRARVPCGCAAHHSGADACGATMVARRGLAMPRHTVRALCLSRGHSCWAASRQHGPRVVGLGAAQRPRHSLACQQPAPRCPVVATPPTGMCAPPVRRAPSAACVGHVRRCCPRRARLACGDAHIVCRASRSPPHDHIGRAGVCVCGGCAAMLCVCVCGACDGVVVNHMRGDMQCAHM